MNDYLEYRAALARNREVFLLNEGLAVTTFSRIDRRFDDMINALKGARTARGTSQFSMMPMMELMRRGFRAAFQAMSSFQSYEAWFLIRPAIEIPLILGKWLDDRGTVEIWKNRFAKPKEYRNCFVGKALQSKALVDSDRIQVGLSRLNDLFAHPNPDYCVRHMKLLDDGQPQLHLLVEYFDEPRVVQVAWLAMSHLMVFVQDRLWRAIAATLVSVSPDHIGLESFEATFRKGAHTAANESEVFRSMLADLGLWEFKSDQSG